MSARAPETTRTPQEDPVSTTTAPARDRAATPPPRLADVGHVPFVRLVRTELRKLVDTRAGRWLLISIVLITALAMGVALWVNRDSGTGMMALLATANIPQGVLVPILGIMSAANEWSQRTALITFTQEPRRLRVMAAKSVAAVVLGLGVLVLTSLLAVAAHAGSMAVADGGSVDVWVGWPMVASMVIMQVLGVLMGVAFGALLLNVPLGIVAYFLVPTLSPLLFMITAWLREHAAWFDMGTAQLVLLTDTWPTGVQWAQIGTTSLLWIALPLAIGCWRVVRREVK